MPNESTTRNLLPNRPSRPAHTIAVMACVVALSSTIGLIQNRPQRFCVNYSSTTLAQIGRLEAQFHECYARWEPEHGVRSPCPELQNDINIKLLHLLRLQKAHPSEIIRIVGSPEAVYEHGQYPGIFYWRLKNYWATTAPNCVMLLPRNPQYDAMIYMALKQNGARQSSAACAISTASSNQPANHSGLETRVAEF